MELRVGMVGAGYAAHLRARAIRTFNSERVRMVAVFDKEAAHARQLAEEHGLACPASLEELCAYPGLNAVSIAVPNRFHYEIARYALERGLHVLCEYPLVLADYRQAASLVRLAERRGLALHVGQTMNYDADHRFLLEHRGELGRLYLGYKFMSFGALGSWYRQDGFGGDYRGLGSWYVEHHRAGGWIVSSHYHGIQVFRRVFGEVLSVAAFDSTAAGVSAGSVLMRHRDGAGTSIQWGMPMQGQPFNKTIVSGSEGSVEVESGRFVLQTGSRREEGTLAAVDTFVEDLKALVEELDGRRDARAERADMLRNLRVAMTAERAAASGRVLKVGD